MLAVVVLACDPAEVVDWAKACADKARMDAISRRKRNERTVDDAIIGIRDGGSSTTNVGGSTSVVVW